MFYLQSFTVLQAGSDKFINLGTVQPDIQFL